MKRERERKKKIVVNPSIRRKNPQKKKMDVLCTMCTIYVGLCTMCTRCTVFLRTPPSFPVAPCPSN